MICKNCGADIPEDSTVCTNCGAAAETVAPLQNPQPVYANPAGVQPVSPSKVLVWGILGLAFSDLGILGIIFSAIGLKYAKRFMFERGSLFGQAKVGRILAKVGLIVSIVMTVLLPFIIIGYVSLIRVYVDFISNLMYY